MTPTDLRARRRALYALCTGMLMIVLDATIVNVALPVVGPELKDQPVSHAVPSGRRLVVLAPPRS